MQPDADSVLKLQIFNLGSGVLISPAARDYILRCRPELAAEFETIGDQARISIASLLKPALDPPHDQFVPSSGFRVPGSTNPERGTRNSDTITGLGDFVAYLLRRLGIHATIALLQRRRLLGGCQCAARQDRLNALTPRLRGLFEPWPLTLAVLLSWILFGVALLAR